MEWTDRAIVLATRRHGESGLIVEAMTYAHGRHLGLVRGGRSSRLRSAFQPGNTVELTWRARLEEHLGLYSGDMTVARAAGLMADRLTLSGLSTAVALARLLPEREPGPRLAHDLEDLLDRMAVGGAWIEALVRYEMAILDDLGFGLDLTRCALTGVTGDLAWVSPKTGRAASAEAGSVYAEKLLPLPAFLAPGSAEGGVGDPEPQSGELLAGLRLTGFFLDRHVYSPRGLTAPESRNALLRAVERGG